MFCKYCGKDSGNSDVCNECNEKINSYIKNSNMEESTVDKNDCDSYMEQTENIVNNDAVTEYRGFFTMPRVMGLIGSIIFAFCCIVPMYMYGEENYFSLIDLKKGETFLLIPLFMLLNVKFDKFITRVTLSGIHSGFFRFKLCILWAIIGICAIIICPCIISINTNTVLEYTPIFYIAIIGCALLIIAPFLVKENDGTGIKPIKKYDYIWIVLSVLIAVLLCFATVSKKDEVVYNDNILEENLEGTVTFDATELMGCTYNGNDTVVVELVMTNNTSESLRFDDTFELKLFELGAEKSKVTIGSDFPIPDVYGKDMSLQTIESQYPAAIFNAFTVDDISNTFVVEVVSKYDESNVVFTTSDTPYKTAYYESNDEYYAGDEPVYDSSYYDEANDELSDEDMYQVIESFMNEYCSSMVAAINYNDYSLVSPYIGSGSLLEESQKKLIESLNEKGISEEFEGISIDYVEYDDENDNLYIYVTETETIYYPMSEPETKTYNWIYTMNGYEDYIWLTNIE